LFWIVNFFLGNFILEIDSRNLTSFELYCGGCGLSGLVVAHFAKETLLSDCFPSIICNLEYSISLNPHIKMKTRAILLDWFVIESNPEIISEISSTISFHFFEINFKK
jgi:hypothetical protein